MVFASKIKGAGIGWRQCQVPTWIDSLSIQRNKQCLMNACRGLCEMQSSMEAVRNWKVGKWGRQGGTCVGPTMPHHLKHQENISTFCSAHFSSTNFSKKKKWIEGAKWKWWRPQVSTLFSVRLSSFLTSYQTQTLWPPYGLSTVLAYSDIVNLHLRRTLFDFHSFEYSLF